MASSLPQYQNPADIRIYGRMVDKFSKAAKAFAGYARIGKKGEKRTANLPDSNAESIAGEGRYNSQSELPSYIIYGPKKTAAARSKNTGLFGGFFFVHLPELRMSLDGPKLLGEKGCCLIGTVDGESISLPLQKVVFDFLPRKDDRPGTIVIARDIENLKAGTPLIKGREWAKGWYIVDTTGQPLAAEPSAMMLWGHVGAMGFKKYGRSSVEFETLKTDGVDDDFTAENHMIAWLESVRNINGIDLMPAFNAYVRKAHEQLMLNPEFLSAFARAVGFLETVDRAVTASPVIEDYSYNGEPHLLKNRLQAQEELRAFKEVADHLKSIREAAHLLALPLLPDKASPDFLKEVETRVTSCADLINKECLVDIRRRKILYHSQTPDPFSPLWVAGKGNTISDRWKIKFLEWEPTRIWPQLKETIRTALQEGMVEKAATALDSLAGGLYKEDNTADLPYREAATALRRMRSALKAGGEIGDLSEDVEKVRKLYTEATEMFSLSPMPIRTVSDLEREGYAILAKKGKSLTPRKLKKEVGFHVKQMQRRVESGLLPKVKAFIDFMDAIDCDGDRWRAAYGECPALGARSRPQHCAEIGSRHLAALAGRPSLATVANLTAGQ